MPALPSIDPVTRFFKSQGLQPEVAYFGKSDFVVGWRVRLSSFEVVYRCENTMLTVCSFIANQGDNGAGGAVSQFIVLVHQIECNIKQLNSVRGCFVESFADPEISRDRRRLASILLAKGAAWQKIDGESWLVYPLGSKGARS
ncbi:hypothetical protein [Pseudomonas sp. TH31]|uniref:hypothetical protein n=1 Tax=Pseudomonas sp. TH31 TaxID=2796396 RepID=UPI001912EFF5|nr:hypothetical protein [Pseudomonas sp. TH31]MBK5415400.1 hypothetical protein [Pseudomonas sp. TH31]